jgi:hypothetical protein
VGFDVRDQLLIRFLYSSDSGEEMGNTMRYYVSYSGFKKAYDSMTCEAFYNILIGCGVHMKLVRLIKFFLN